MADIFRPQDTSTYLYWCSCIIDEASDKLNGWETGFVHDLEIKLGEGYQLTEAQANKLEQIYVKYTS